MEDNFLQSFSDLPNSYAEDLQKLAFQENIQYAMGKPGGVLKVFCPYLDVKVKIETQTCLGIKLCEFAVLEPHNTSHESKEVRSTSNYEVSEDFPNVPVLLLTATCSQATVQKIMTKVVPKPSKLEKLFENICKYLDSITLGRYHGSLNDAAKNTNLARWKNGCIRIMCATNAFGMDINVADIQIIIHTTFPISLVNFIQEIGRAARDGQESKSILFFSQADVQNLLYILTDKRASSYKFSDNTQSQLYEAQTNNTSIEQYHLAKRTNKILEMQFLERCHARESTTTFFHVSRSDVGDVFIMTKNKDFVAKGLMTLEEYGKQNKKSPITSKSVCLCLYDQLVLKGLVQQNVILKPIRPGSATLILTYEIIGVNPNATLLATDKEWKMFAKPN
ncbi:4747_t:CDS:2 [Ambispora gerdemannii]|uniref:DNA 3'-5' helicase n=1 Tax=Ambispora gerdemannii TaxID=144530 RepID=A0A9N8ZKF7_9GLOM|nr:4747_t:CDS:2 [Ambispora gerdemannii]